MKCWGHNDASLWPFNSFNFIYIYDKIMKCWGNNDASRWHFYSSNFILWNNDIGQWTVMHQGNLIHATVYV